MQHPQNSQADQVPAGNWAHLTYFGFQTGGAAFVLSLALAQPAHYLLKMSLLHNAKPGLIAMALHAGWLAVGYLCAAPLAWALKRRLDGVLNRPNGFRPDNAEQIQLYRKAVIFSLISIPFWWLAPSLMGLH